MMRLRFLGAAALPVYQTTGGVPWYAGEARDVPSEEAERILATHGPAFEAVEPEKPAPKSRKKE